VVMLNLYSVVLFFAIQWFRMVVNSAPYHLFHKVQGTVMSVKELSKSVDLAASLILDLHL
jgi:hypothetical protein